MSLSFAKWRRGSRPVAKLRVEYVLDVRDVMHVLIWTYSKGCESVGELPTALTRAEVERELRRFYAHTGPSAIEASAYDEVPAGEDDAWDRWAAETVARCWPELGEDPDVVAKRGA